MNIANNKENKNELSTDTNGVLVDNVCFSYSETEVLHNISFYIPDKSLVAVVGPNGGGKTTLMRLIIGDLTPRFGKIKLFGETPKNLCHKIGLVPQQIKFDPLFPITVLQAVLTGCMGEKIFGGFSKRDKAIALQNIEYVGLKGLENELFSNLSGGQRQRAIIARALCCNPKILILDEPTANVDPETERSLYSLFQELAKTKIVFSVSHNLQVVISHATHLLCVNHSSDIHILGQEERTKLVPLSNEHNLSSIQNSDPSHIKNLLNNLDSPHNACHCSHTQCS